MANCICPVCNGVGCCVERPDNAEWRAEDKSPGVLQGSERMVSKAAKKGLVQGRLLDNCPGPLAVTS
jgi:hypothetical protein